MKISKINLYEVIVPAKKGTIDSAEINKPLHKLSVGADEGWSIPVSYTHLTLPTLLLV